MEWKNIKKLFHFSSSAGDSGKNIFPKVCPKCAEKYRNSDDFFSKTEGVSSSLLKNESNKPVRIKIKCRCRSCGYLFELSVDKHRDHSDEGYYIRDKFGNLLEMLIAEGMSREDARKEMLKLFDEQERAYPKNNK